MRFIISTRKRTKVIEAVSLDEAVAVADRRFPKWEDVKYCNYNNASGNTLNNMEAA